MKRLKGGTIGRKPAVKDPVSLPFRETQGKIWCLIQAGVQVYVVFYFWEGGKRCFVGGFAWYAVVISGAGAHFVKWRAASS